MGVWVGGGGSVSHVVVVPLRKGVIRGDDVQIVRTKDEPQLVVARSPLHSLQYPVLYLSRMQRICPTRYLNLRSSLTELQLRGDQGHAHVMIDLGPVRSSIAVFSSMDSGLEAFSRNPAHGSFRALSFPTTLCANYANQRFLSY